MVATTLTIVRAITSFHDGLYVCHKNGSTC
jgi:hypothetical protein